MAKRKQGLFALVADLPWPTGVVTGIFAYVLVRYGIGWYLESSGNAMLSAVASAASASALPWIAWALLGVCWAAAIASFTIGKSRKALLETQTGLDSLRSMNWREFEMLTGEAFRRQGYSVDETGLGGADGGVDLILRKHGKTTLVQCKQWKTQRVDVKTVREMYGLLAHHHADAVKIVAVGDYTADALRFAQGKPIDLIHGETLLELVREGQTSKSVSRTEPAPSDAKAATAATPPRPDCPKCGAEMVRRENRRTSESFWGCPKYPACRGTRAA